MAEPLDMDSLGHYLAVASGKGIQLYSLPQGNPVPVCFMDCRRFVLRGKRSPIPAGVCPTMAAPVIPTLSAGACPIMAADATRTPASFATETRADLASL